MLSFSLHLYFSCLLWISTISAIFFFFLRIGEQSFYITATVLLDFLYNHLVHLRFLLLEKQTVIRMYGHM